jgi:hypothetical protein
MSDFEEMIEEMRLATPRGTRMRRGDTQEDIGSQGLAGIEQVQGQDDLLSGDGRVDAPDIIGGQEDAPRHGDAPATDPTTGGGTHDLDKFDEDLLQDYAYCVEQLGEKLDMKGTLFEIMEESGIDDDSKLSKAVEELIGILAYKVFFEEILLMDLTGSASQALETITDEQLSLMELAILTPEEWESDYGIKLNKKLTRRMAAFHHWLANPDPNYPTSNYRRLADMDRNKFENYMMTEWRMPKTPPQSQDPQVAESAGFQPDVGSGNQPTMAASFQAATRQTGTQVAGTINIPPPAGPQSR